MSTSGLLIGLSPNIHGHNASSVRNIHFTYWQNLIKLLEPDHPYQSFMAFSADFGISICKNFKALQTSKEKRVYFACFCSNKVCLTFLKLLLEIGSVSVNKHEMTILPFQSKYSPNHDKVMSALDSYLGENKDCLNTLPTYSMTNAIINDKQSLQDKLEKIDCIKGYSILHSEQYKSTRLTIMLDFILQSSKNELKTQMEQTIGKEHFLSQSEAQTQ